VVKCYGVSCVTYEETNIKLDAQILGTGLPSWLNVVQWHVMFVESWYGPWFVTVLSKRGGEGLLNFWEKFVYPCLKFVR